MEEYSKIMNTKPQHVVDIERALEDATLRKKEAVREQNFELGARFRDAERELKEKLEQVKYFNHHVYNGARMHYGNIDEDIENRLNFELQVINDKEWAKYFLLIRNMLDTIRKKGAIVGSGAGSVTGSLVAYCLQITDIDPIVYDLLFERFINTESKTIPFSVCVDTEGKNEALRFLRAKGITPKEDISDDYPDGDIISKTVFGDTEFVIDIIELKSLSIIRKIVEIHHTDAQVDINIERIPTDDPVVYGKFANNETSWLWSFENTKLEELCLRLFRPLNIEDLAAIYSLIAYERPVEIIAKLIDGKRGYEKIEYEIPEIEKHLRNTYGLTIYQEQVMSISRDLAGFSPCQSDELRKALGKRLTEKTNDFSEMFLDGCIANGYDKNKVAEIYNSWVDYALFYNKSHAISVALTAYRMAWLKTYYPIVGINV